LHPTICEVHGARSPIVLNGRCTIERGRGLGVTLAAWASSLPPASNNVPTTVTITRNNHCNEQWERNFNGHIMRSRLWQQGHLLAERLGLMTLLFALTEDNGDIIWTVRGARFLGIPLPTSWFAKSTARESESNGRYCFDVRVSLPLLGLLIHYCGWLSMIDINDAMD
jgi:Domain of unknown function (DUF4166)